MSLKLFLTNQYPNIIIFAVLILLVISAGCGVEAAKQTVVTTEIKEQPRTSTVLSRSLENEPQTKIEIKQNSPADTVRVFYKSLRENNFQKALYLTNLRPAIEGLNNTELQDLQVDFGHLARSIPTNFEINGEIIVGDLATVTAKMPDEDTNEVKIQEIKLRRENGIWVILTLDKEAEKVVKKEGNNYFFALRIDTHHSEAEDMIERIFKAQLVYSMQNGGTYSDVQTLINAGFLPEDIKTSESTGYVFNIEVAADKKTYQATALPARYGKTGKLSYLLFVDKNQNPHLEKSDKGGQPLKKRLEK